jgi:Ribbon-helix-helix protein, copG family
MLCCMSATRTQIYLTAEQRDLIDVIVEAEGVTLAEVVRRALDDYLERKVHEPGSALASTFGSEPSIAIPSRDEWDRG